MLKSRITLLICALFILSGCKQSSISSSGAPGVDWSSKRNYSWSASSEISNPEHKPIDAGNIAGKVRQAIDQQLAAKGWVSTSPAQADIEVAYIATVATVVDLDNAPKWLNEEMIRTSGTEALGDPYRFTLGGTGIKEYDEGTLSIIFTTPQTNDVLWSSEATAVIDYDASEKKRERRINRIVQRMLKDFPAQR